VRVLYLHGFASGVLSGKAQFLTRQFQSRGVKLEIPDLAAGDFENLTVSGQLAVIGRALNGEPAVLIGSSMGGYLAALYASLHAEIEKLVLLAPAFGFSVRWPDQLGPERTNAWRTSGCMEVFHYGENRPARISWRLIEDGRKWPQEPDFLQPALIFHGTRDDVVPPAFSERFTSGHSNARLRLLDSDHQLSDSVDTIWNETEEFLFQ
jgi:uncharacterized protein